MENVKSIVDIEPFLIDFAKQSERIIGSIIVKKGVVISDKTQQNILVRVVKTITGFDIEFLYRPSLRFADMGVGNGWHKGTKLNLKPEHLNGKEKFRVRKPKNIVNRPVFARAHLLEEALAVEIESIAVESIMQQLDQIGLDERQKKALIVRHIMRKEGDRISKSTLNKYKKWL